MSDWKLVGVGRVMVEDTILILHGRTRMILRNNVKLHKSVAFIIDFYVHKQLLFILQISQLSPVPAEA
jgi:hypothetical protein